MLDVRHTRHSDGSESYEFVNAPPDTTSMRVRYHLTRADGSFAGWLPDGSDMPTLEFGDVCYLEMTPNGRKPRA